MDPIINVNDLNNQGEPVRGWSSTIQPQQPKNVVQNRGDLIDVDRNKTRTVHGTWRGGAWELIESYFKNIGYQPIESTLQCVLVHNLGIVYRVEFDGVENNKPCYAIIKDGKCSGYAEDFWSDADKYKLVLKQHLGMLEVDAFDRGEHPKQQVQNPKTPPTPQGSDAVAFETMDAVVGRYEGLVKTLNNEVLKWIGACRYAEKNRDDLQAKLRAIQDVLTGRPVEAARVPTPEECMIDQNADDVAGMVGADDATSVAVSPSGLGLSKQGCSSFGTHLRYTNCDENMIQKQMQEHVVGNQGQ